MQKKEKKTKSHSDGNVCTVYTDIYIKNNDNLAQMERKNCFMENKKIFRLMDYYFRWQLPHLFTISLEKIAFSRKSAYTFMTFKLF